MGSGVGRPNHNESGLLSIMAGRQAARRLVAPASPLGWIIDHRHPVDRGPPHLVSVLTLS
jgi:hypothetical protein